LAACRASVPRPSSRSSSSTVVPRGCRVPGGTIASGAATPGAWSPGPPPAAPRPSPTESLDRPAAAPGV